MPDINYKYSKEAKAVIQESGAWVRHETERLAYQRRVPAHLADAAPRPACIVCAGSLANAPQFEHRDVPYVRCGRCGHVQTKAAPPASYPEAFVDEARPDYIYPKLDAAAYVSRRDNIYRPKLNWIIDVLKVEGWSDASLKAARWAELGTGAGYFLHALQDYGVPSIVGIEANRSLVENANEMLSGGLVQHHEGTLEDAVRALDAEIFASFFVLEHVDPSHAFWEALGEKPSGTIFAFSVPCFSLATLLESATCEYSARNLDSLVHTQLYTDRSISHALDLAGFDPVACWIFGQDSFDLGRLLTNRIAERCDEKILADVKQQVEALLDPLQAVIDRQHFADARHMLARKR